MKMKSPNSLKPIKFKKVFSQFLSSFKKYELEIMFEGIKIFSTLECVQSFIPKSWTNI